MRPIAGEALPRNTLRGVSLIVGVMFVTSVQDVVFKLFSESLPLGQIFALRALLAIPLLMALAWVQGMSVGVWRHALSGWTLIRSLFITFLFLGFYGAIPFVSLSVLGAGTYTAPIFVALLSACFLSESLRRRDWIAILVGFAGVLVLLRPGTDAFSPWAALPVAGAVLYAMAHVITRLKCQAVPLVAMALSLKLVMMVAGLGVSLVVLIWTPDASLVVANPYLLAEWQPVGTTNWFVLGLLAILTILIGLGMAGAYKATSPSTVATFEYSYLVLVAFWDVLFFGISPSIISIVGIVLIVGAGTAVLHGGRDNKPETSTQT